MIYWKSQLSCNVGVVYWFLKKFYSEEKKYVVYENYFFRMKAVLNKKFKKKFIDEGFIKALYGRPLFKKSVKREEIFLQKRFWGQ